jgi:hypothetical protein
MSCVKIERNTDLRASIIPSAHNLTCIDSGYVGVGKIRPHVEFL